MFHSEGGFPLPYSDRKRNSDGLKGHAGISGFRSVKCASTSALLEIRKRASDPSWLGEAVLLLAVLVFSL